MNAPLLHRFAILFAAFCAPAHGQDAPAWPDTLNNRRAAVAMIQDLSSEILASRSATQVLQKWCGDHKLAEKPEITAHRMEDVNKAPTPEQRQRLQIGETEPVKYRRVELRCGDRVLSVADNWYVPGRMEPEMNRLLETTRTPFGVAVRKLEPYRQTISSRLLWSPLADETAAGNSATLDIPAALFEHRAVLYTGEQRPFSEVHEIYQRAVLAFPAPPAP